MAIRNIVLVHGNFVDGSGWQGVYGHLTPDGYRVAVAASRFLTGLVTCFAARRVQKDQQADGGRPITLDPPSQAAVPESWSARCQLVEMSLMPSQ